MYINRSLLDPVSSLFCVKMKRNQSPPVLLTRAMRLWLTGRVRFSRDEIGKIINEEEDFQIFRKIIMQPKDHFQIAPGAIFKVKFHFARFSPAANKLISLVPIPLIIAQPGFMSKTWLTGLETGCFQGLYEWETLETAQNYEKSLPFELMKKRVVADSLNIQITQVHD